MYSVKHIFTISVMNLQLFVYLGAEGVGRRTLKNRVAASDPTRFATAIPRKALQSIKPVFHLANLFARM